MGWIAWIAVGAVAGFLASMIVGSREGLVMMIVLGIVGGILGGFVAANVLHVGSVNGFNLESILIATLGAAGVLLVVHLATGGRGLRRS
ncbi:MAG: GlsB/YeaQ/YmgE family stress response membrane protein [Chloroflexi bacterium]|nr:MAG: GlsB/YeaQ/YmgE family stress response membrane protein [Chloroflexota bacterium]